MRQVVRHVAGATAALVLALAWTGGNAAFAQGELTQVKLTEDAIKKYIAIQKQLAALPATGEKSEEKSRAEFEAVVKKNGFANAADFENVSGTISLVMSGLDQQGTQYTDPKKTMQADLEEIRKDTTMPEKEKKQHIDELTEAIKNTPDLQHKENIDLVKKHFKEIEGAQGTN
ncbi:MAG: hypothetical protein ACREC6_01375 [Hyphomicrobiaceae bacterium]